MKSKWLERGDRRLDLHGEWGTFTLRQGESAVVPAVAEVSGVTGHEVEAFAAHC